MWNPGWLLCPLLCSFICQICTKDLPSQCRIQHFLFSTHHVESAMQCNKHLNQRNNASEKSQNAKCHSHICFPPHSSLRVWKIKCDITRRMKSLCCGYSNMCQSRLWMCRQGGESSYVAKKLKGLESLSPPFNRNFHAGMVSKPALESWWRCT